MFMYCFKEGDLDCLKSSGFAFDLVEVSEIGLSDSFSFSFLSFFATIPAISSGISVLSLKD